MGVQTPNFDLPQVGIKPGTSSTRGKCLTTGAYNNRNGQERTGMDRNTQEWASITGMDIKLNLFYATKFIILP